MPPVTLQSERPAKRFLHNSLDSPACVPQATPADQIRVTSAGASPGIVTREYNAIPTPVVDNFTCSYRLSAESFDWSSASSNLRILQVIIKYTLAEAQ